MRKFLRTIKMRLSNFHQIYELKKQVLEDQVFSRWFLFDQLNRNTALPEQVSCPICASKLELKTLKEYRSYCIFGGGELLRYQCSHCEVIFGPLKMLNLSDEALMEDYKLHYRVYEEGDVTQDETRAFELLNPNKQGVYLNYGCGQWSKTLEQLNHKGYTVYGYDPVSGVADHIDHVISTPTDLMNFRFDGIFTNNVLEHWKNPFDELKKLEGLLKDGGQLVLSTDCFEYRHEHTRFHLFYFMGDSKNHLVKGNGFSIEQFIQDGDFMALSLRKHPPLPA